ncbi:MAG TPA: superinfection immunity protein [Chryseosolibacter sp.]
MEIILILGAFVLYFLPSIIGYSKANAGAIFVLNFFLGWTLIGWVVAIVWAMTVDPPKPVIPHTYTPPKQSTSSVDEIMKLSSLREKGAITEAEYQREKEKILKR